MTHYTDLLNRIYAASHAGLDIILNELPQAEVCRSNPKKKFKLRQETDASACLYAPQPQQRDYWKVYDFGGPEGERHFSPIDLVMWRRNLEFWPALQMLAEEYGVDARLSAGVNKPVIEQRPATPDEADGKETLILRDDITPEGLAVWGHGASADVLRRLGWAEVEQIRRTRGGTTTIITRTRDYVIFRQRCYYTDAQNAPASFDKLYEPQNPQKQYRFHSVGTKPRAYIFGLDAVAQLYQERGSQKLDAVCLVSGGSDAVACWSRGVPAVYMGSERDRFGQAEYKRVMVYCQQLYNVPDLDATGRDEGRRKALELPDMNTVWLDDQDMYGLHDQRGGRRKDLKDFLDLHHEPDTMRKLMARAVKARCWDTATNPKTGEISVRLAPTRLDYMLWLLGFCTLRDNDRDAPVYLHFTGNKVRYVKAKNIVSHLLAYAEREAWPESVRNKLRTTRAMPSAQKSTLRPIDHVDIVQATATQQPMFFRNCWLMVSKDSVERHSYSELSDRFIWADRIIQHDYREMPRMFDITQDTDGNYHVTFPNGIQSKLMQFFVNTSRLYWRKVDEQGLELTPEEQADEARCLVSRIANAGYLLHLYKSLAAAYATVCLDNKVGQTKSEANGRTGKTLYALIMGMLTNYVYREARRREDVSSRFFFGGITEENGLCIIDECHPGFDIGQLYGRITGPFTSEQKGEPIRTIPFERSPKLVLATNTVITVHDQSTEGRLWYQTFSDFYHVRTADNDYLETRTVRDDIGCILMDSEYPEADWQQDCAFLVQCLQYHLSLPQSQWKVDPPLKQIRQRELQTTVSTRLDEWAAQYLAPEAGHLNTAIPTHEVYSSFREETKSPISPITFNKQLKAYCKLAGITYNPAAITGKEKDGEPYYVYNREHGRGCCTAYFQSATPPTETHPKNNNTEEEALPF